MKMLHTKEIFKYEAFAILMSPDETTPTHTNKYYQFIPRQEKI